MYWGKQLDLDRVGELPYPLPTLAVNDTTFSDTSASSTPDLEKGCFGMHSGGSSDDVDEENRIRMGKFYTNKLEALLGKPRPRNQELSQKEMDIAKSTQVRFEEASVHCIKKLHSLVQCLYHSK